MRTADRSPNEARCIAIGLTVAMTLKADDLKARAPIEARLAHVLLAREGSALGVPLALASAHNILDHLFAIGEQGFVDLTNAVFQDNEL